jgi:regulator of sigma D
MSDVQEMVDTSNSLLDQWFHMRATMPVDVFNLYLALSLSKMSTLDAKAALATLVVRATDMQPIETNDTSTTN